METSKKLSSSRLLKLVLIGLVTLVGIKLIFFGFSIWITNLIIAESDPVKIESYLNLMGILNIRVAGAIATIITAAIARYGLRESTKNLTLPAGVAGSKEVSHDDGK